MSSVRGLGATRTPITRIFVGSALEVGEEIELPQDEARHVFKVLRAREGEPVEVVDGRGHLFLAKIGGGREASVLRELPAAGEVDVVLYQAVPKGGRMDLVVEKATEVGASEIVPLLTEHGVVNPREGKVGRWRRVAEAAARQSLRLRVPKVREPLPFEAAVQEASGGGVVLHNADELPPVEDVVGRPVRLFVGPEGGWSAGELAFAEGNGLRLARLGPFRLRSETAGIVAVARALGRFGA